VPPEYNNIRWAIASGANLTRAQLVAPSLGVQRQSLEVVPRRRGAATLSLTHREVYVPERPVALRPSEELEFQAAEDAAGASAVYGVVTLGPAELPPMPEGQLREVRATGTTALTANAWTTVSLTPDLSLEPGIYTLVGFLPISANCIAARALITGQVYRPGMPGLAGTEATAVDFDAIVDLGIMGYAMGEFSHLTFPQFQFLASAADASETVILWVVRTGEV
jgi:hypothetical protein